MKSYCVHTVTHTNIYQVNAALQIAKIEILAATLQYGEANASVCVKFNSHDLLRNLMRLCAMCDVRVQDYV